MTPNKFSFLALTLCLLFTFTFIFTPLVAGETRLFKEDAGCSGTASKNSQGNWTIKSAGCTGACGTNSCTVSWTAQHRWCGCNGLQPACCFVRIKNPGSNATVEAAGDCPSCPTTGSCILYEIEFEGNDYKKVKCD